jgi:hypothetical protein
MDGGTGLLGGVEYQWLLVSGGRKHGIAGALCVVGAALWSLYHPIERGTSMRAMRGGVT